MKIVCDLLVIGLIESEEVFFELKRGYRLRILVMRYSACLGLGSFKGGLQIANFGHSPSQSFAPHKGFLSRPDNISLLDLLISLDSSHPRSSIRLPQPFTLIKTSLTSALAIACSYQTLATLGSQSAEANCKNAFGRGLAVERVPPINSLLINITPTLLHLDPHPTSPLEHSHTFSHPSDIMSSSTTFNPIFKLSPGAQSYDWGKIGSSSLTAQFAETCVEGFKTDEKKPYAEVRGWSTVLAEIGVLAYQLVTYRSR